MSSPESTSSSSSSESTNAPPKRAHEEEEGRAKRQRHLDAPQSKAAPIYLFATTTDVQARRNSGRDHWSRRQCLTLREMLGIGDTATSTGSSSSSSSSLTAMGPIDFLFLSNYIINFEFLLDECPELLSLPRAVCIYGSKEGTENAWRQACTTLDGSCSVDFLCRNPSDPPKSATNPLPQKFTHGLHHSKLFLVGFSCGVLRVVIHTANLRFSDIHHKAQAAYLQDFYRKPQPNNATNDFQDTLLEYIQSYQYNQKHKWDEHPDSTKSTLVQHLKHYDFSTASVTLIPSIPGHHKLNQRKYGHLKLRQLIQNLAQTRAASAANTTTTTTTGPIVCQFSSIGSLTPEYLHRLARSMNVHRPATTADDTSASSDDVDDNDDDTKPPQYLQLCYPTSDEICNSLEGYKGGNSVPGIQKNVSKQFLRPLLRKWSGSVSFLSSLSLSRKDDHANTNPLWKGTNVPHLTTYYQLSNQDEEHMEWFLMGSHNLSKAAWGDIQKSTSSSSTLSPSNKSPTPNNTTDKRFLIRHWELSIFLSPEQLQAKRFVPWSPIQQEQSKNNPDIVTIPLPFRVKPFPYKDTDQPWAVDERYVRLDIFGRRSASDA